MSWTTPRTFVTGEIETAAIFNTHLRDNLNFLKNGVSASALVTSNAGPTSGTTELVVATAPAVTLDGSTPIEIVFSWYNVSLTVGTDAFLMKLYDGPTAGSGTQIAQWLLANGTTSPGSGAVRVPLTPASGSHTYTGRLVRSSGTGTGTMSASSVAPAAISVAQVN